MNKTWWTLYRSSSAVSVLSHTVSASKYMIYWKSTGECHSVFFTAWHHQKATPCDKFEYKNDSNFHEKCDLTSVWPILQANYQFVHIMKFIIIFTVVVSILGHTMTTDLTSKYFSSDHLQTSIFIQIYLFNILRFWTKITEDVENEAQALPANRLQQM